MTDNTQPPKKGTAQYEANEKLIKKNPVLRDLRDASGHRPSDTSWSGGKGSAPRPINKAKFDDNWDRIFGKKD